MTRSEWAIEPKDFIRYLRSTARPIGSRIRVPPRHVIVFGEDYFEMLRTAFRARKPRWDRSYAIGRAGRYAVAVQRVPVGSPAAAIGLEEAIGLGARAVVTFGGCGSIRADVPVGSLVVPSRAYSEEGTSRHYGGRRWAHPDPALATALAQACQRRGVAVRPGGVWSTDAVYRVSLRTI